MSQDEAYDGRDSQQTNLPPRLDRPRWRLLPTLLGIGASLGIASNLAQLEQRLIPGLLDSPPWLAPVLYVGVTCLPLLEIIRLAFLEARCAYLRVRWYNRLHEIASRNAEQHAVETAEKEERIRALERLVDRATTLAGLFHTLPVVDAAFEGGTLILIADVVRQYRVAPGDLFVVVSREELEVLGTFRLSRASARGYHLVPVQIADGVWWATLRRSASTLGIDPDALLAIMVPVGSSGLE